MSLETALNRYIHTISFDYNGILVYNILNSRSNRVIAAFAIHDEIQEPVIQTTEKTVWNIECIQDLLKYIKSVYSDEFKQEEYLEFSILRLKSRKTPIYKINNFYFERGTNEIKWHAPWRQFCLFSNQSHIRVSELEECLLKLQSLNKRKGDLNE